MSLLDDDTPVSLLTIPGTHDSSAFTSSWPFISTQSLSYHAQLDAGIRYFDFRCTIRNNVVEMVHGPTFLGLTFESVLETLYAWLEKHPTEALIVQIKKESEDQRSTIRLEDAISSHLAARPDRWRTANTVPKLGELRGRIQLFRRYVDANLHAFGLDVTRWMDNPRKPFTIYTHHDVKVTIQDHYTFVTPQSLPDFIAMKGGNVSELMRLAAASADPDHWFINFTSAFQLNLYYQFPPRKIAVGGWHFFRWQDGINVRLRGSLADTEGEKRHFGIFAMDFPEQGAPDLIATLINTNFDLSGETWWWDVPGYCILLLVLAMLLYGAYAGI